MTVLSVLLTALISCSAPAGDCDSFVSDLMSRMTLEEKVGQLNLPVASSKIVTGDPSSQDIMRLIRNSQAGALFNAIGYENLMAFQRAAVNESRLGIPLIFGLDVIHGYKTIFPVPLALASSWDMDLVEQTSRAAATESAADGLNWLYGPMVDISRDPRWGRCVESPGEDPYLSSRYAEAAVKGYQGNLSDNTEVLACVKHFALYGASESGRDYSETDMSLERMLNVYLQPYHAAVKAGAATVMSSFNDVNGLPATSNKWLLDTVLRKQWGFKGFVVSDYNAVKELSAHGLGDEHKAAVMALRAGTDMDMVCSYFLNNICDAVRSGELSESVVDDACRRILTAKYRLGLFQNPYKYISKDGISGDVAEAASQLALKAATESFVLLKNNGDLPLKAGSRVALVGPFADDGSQYTGSWAAMAKDNYPSIRSALCKNKNLDIRYARGSNIMEDAELEKAVTYRRKYVRDMRDTDSMIKEAVSLAKRSDVIVACLGEGAYMSGESGCRTSLRIPDCQERLLRQLVLTGKPVILVLFSGRPLVLEWENKNLSSILEVWYGGSQTGQAIADVLTGKSNPSGKLPMTFPRTEGQIPIYCAHKPLGRPNREDDGFNRYRSSWIDSPTSPLYPFGFGLSYSKFEYSEISLDSTSLAGDGSIKASVAVTNTSDVDGVEIVQLYIRDVESSMTRPVKELKGFKRVFIPAGSTVDVEFEISQSMLSWYYTTISTTEPVTEPGEFEIMIGPDSRDVKSATIYYRRSGVETVDFGVLDDGTTAHKFTLVNENGSSMELTDFGARIISINVPDREGRMADVVVGPGDLETFSRNRFFGCVIGRYANRINHSSFTLDGVEYPLDANESFAGVPVHCHGGSQGFDLYVWDAAPLIEEDRVGVRFARMSTDGEAGFPGNCECSVTYWLTNDNVVKVEYEAATDKPTVVNLSNHTYFNLKGNEGGYVMEHLLCVEADSCIQNNLQLCPDIVMPVEGTPFDFKEPHRVDYRLDMPSKHLEIMRGMSACWVVRNWDSSLRRVADLYDRHSGRGVQVWTTEPALLTYTGRGFNGAIKGKYGPIEKYSGMLLETIHMPDSPNQNRFPSTVLRPDDRYYSCTEWHFYAK